MVRSMETILVLMTIISIKCLRLPAVIFYGAVMWNRKGRLCKLYVYTFYFIPFIGIILSDLSFRISRVILGLAGLWYMDVRYTLNSLFVSVLLRYYVSYLRAFIYSLRVSVNEGHWEIFLLGIRLYSCHNLPEYIMCTY